MADGEQKNNDFYAVLGLKKECSEAELRNAYKKLALQWHPDRCSASGNPKRVDEAKKNFQSIQEAYSVLSDSNKRFLYDIGAYNENDDDDDENGMREFLGEMAEMMMMNETDPSGNGQQSFEDLQELFDEMFQSDLEAFNFSDRSSSTSQSNPFSSGNTHNDNGNIGNGSKRFCSGLVNSERSSSFDAESIEIPRFCIGANGNEKKGKRRKERRIEI